MSNALPAAPALPERVTFPSADLDRRFSAFAIDRLLGWGLSVGVGYAVLELADADAVWAISAGIGTSVLVGLVLAIVLGVTGLTPGKALVGLRVVRRSDGRPIGVGPAIVRMFVLGLAGWPTAGMGLATLAWTAAADPNRERRARHDHFGDAVVVDVRPMPVVEQEQDDRPQQIVNLTAMRLMPVVMPSQPVPVPTPRPPAERAPQPAAAPAPAPMPAPNPAPMQAPGPQAAPAPAPVPLPARPAPTTPPAPATPPVPAMPAPARPPGSHRAVPDAPVAPTPAAQERTRMRPSATPPSAPPPVQAPPKQGRWRVSFDTGEAFVVEGLALVGRRPEPRSGEPVRHVVPLRSSDMSLSKTHAQFQVAPDGALVVMDRGSTNGSFIIRRGMSKPLAPGRPTTLLADDVVQFGDRSMRVEQER